VGFYELGEGIRPTPPDLVAKTTRVVPELGVCLVPCCSRGSAFGYYLLEWAEGSWPCRGGQRSQGKQPDAAPGMGSLTRRGMGWRVVPSCRSDASQGNVVALAAVPGLGYGAGHGAGVQGQGCPVTQHSKGRRRGDVLAIRVTAEERAELERRKVGRSLGRWIVG